MRVMSYTSNNCANCSDCRLTRIYYQTLKGNLGLLFLDYSLMALSNAVFFLLLEL